MSEIWTFDRAGADVPLIAVSAACHAVASSRIALAGAAGGTGHLSHIGTLIAEAEIAALFKECNADSQKATI